MAKKSKNNTLEELSAYLKRKPHSIGEEEEERPELPRPDFSFSNKDELITSIKRLSEKEDMPPLKMVKMLLAELLLQEDSLSVSEEMTLNILLYTELFDEMKQYFSEPRK